jgi:antagonist of KipI
VKLEVIRPGIHATVQDLGRFGFRRHGVSTGGALDSMSVRTANLLVGNAESAAVIEMAIGGLRVRLADERIVAWCGAPFDARIGQLALPAGRACRTSAGAEIIFRAPPTGMRAWLAVSGGIDVPLVLGSRSTDLRAGFGGCEGRMLREGDALPLGSESVRSNQFHMALPLDACASWGASGQPRTAAPLLRVMRGRDAAPPAFFEQPFTVTPDSDRMGLRLSGAVLQASSASDVSEAVAPGTIQLPPGGQPIVLLADCQTIGGYPKIAHVITADLPRAAQLRPGDRIRFCEVSVDQACALHAVAERSIEMLRVGLALHLA